MICLAADPGPTRFGLATVRLHEGRLRIVECAHRPLNPRCRDDIVWIDSHIREVMREDGAVAIEQIQGTAYTPDRVPALLETKGAEQGLMWVACHMGATVREVPATTVRHDLVLDGQASDPRIAVVVEWLYGAKACHERITDPKQRPHIYDALLLAAWHIGSATGRLGALRPSGAIATQLLQMRQAEQAARAHKKAERKAAAPIKAILAGAVKSGVVPTITAIAGTIGCTTDAVVASLRVVGRGRSDIATAARALLRASGIATTDAANKRVGTRVQRAARKDSARRGAATRARKP